MKNLRSIRNESVPAPTGGLKKACWKGYVAVGTKQKKGRTVPNCVPKNEEYGAGFEGTPELVNKFKSGTPGQQEDATTFTYPNYTNGLNEKDIDEAHSDRLDNPFQTRHGSDEKAKIGRAHV